MGAINYATSDYITLGVNISELEDMNTTYFGEREELDRNSIEVDLDIMREDVEAELEKYDFWFYHVTIKPGYYDGFSIDIERNFFVYDSYEDKQDAQKEITKIKAFLLKCVDLGLVACYPGWCTAYEDSTGTRKTIQATVKYMRNETRNTPTLNQYER